MCLISLWWHSKSWLNVFFVFLFIIIQLFYLSYIFFLFRIESFNVYSFFFFFFFEEEEEEESQASSFFTPLQFESQCCEWLKLETYISSLLIIVWSLFWQFFNNSKSTQTRLSCLKIPEVRWKMSLSVSVNNKEYSERSCGTRKQNGYPERLSVCL